jgi:hypothetical protein
MNFALNLAANRLPGITINWTMPAGANAAADAQSTPALEETRLEPLITPGGVSDSTRAAALQQFQAQSAQDSAAITQASAARRMNRAPSATAVERQDQILAGLLIGSPEFQRR